MPKIQCEACYQEKPVSEFILSKGYTKVYRCKACRKARRDATKIAPAASPTIQEIRNRPGFADRHPGLARLIDKTAKQD